MAGNTFGKLFTLTTFGASHGDAIGGVIDGVPANFELDLSFVQKELNRRKPGQSKIVTQRKEADEVVFLSGIFEGKTTGFPIAFHIENSNQKSTDYDHLKSSFRPSHADFTYQEKFGHRDHRGGGRSSARETANWVVAGAIAKQFLQQMGVKITAFVDQVGTIKLDKDSPIDFATIEKNPVRCPNLEVAQRMEEFIKSIRKAGDTVGGCISCSVENVPTGWGEPIFDKLHARLGQAMLTINAVKGFEYGSGFAGSAMSGSEHNDLFNKDGSTKSNFSGGIQGGISNGQPIYFRVAFKPVATLMKDQQTINKDREEVTIKGKGRHDPCVVPRAVVIVESMAALCLMDIQLIHKARKND